MYKTNLTQANIETIFRNSFLKCLDDFNYLQIPVLQHYDYQKKGKQHTAVYFTLQNPRKVGNAYRVYNTNDNKSNYKELQHYEATILLTTLSDEEKRNIAPIDLALNCACIVGSLTFIELMKNNGIGIQSISDIRTLNILDESNNFILECNFDFKISFNKELISNTKLIKQATFNKITII